MFFREKKSPSGQVLQLLEAFRDEEKRSRNRIVVSLGSACIAAQDRPMIAKAVEQRLYGCEDFFGCRYSKVQADWIERIVRRVDLGGQWFPLRERKPGRVEGQEVLDGVLIDQVEHEQTAMLGPVLAGHKAWKALGMDELLSHLGYNPAQQVAAAVNVINRLVEPLSEHALEDWVRSTALPELLGPQAMSTGDDRYYRISDRLWEDRQEITAHLRRRERQIFSLPRTIFLYDLTNTYFEGEALANAKAQRGNSKEGRHEQPLVVVGLVFDESGFALGHEVFEGNRHDAKTLADMVRHLDAVVAEERSLFSGRSPLVIVDGGVASAKNLATLRQAGFDYLVNDSRRGRKAWHKEFKQDDQFTLLPGRDGKSPVSIRKITAPVEAPQTPPDCLVLCKSTGRHAKEQAIYSQAEQRLLEDLGRLARLVDSGRQIDEVKIQRRIGRILGRHSRAARFYNVELVAQSPDKPKTRGRRRANRWKLLWQRCDEQADQQADLWGCYVLRSCRHDLEGPELWDLYIMLTRAERGFRCLKSDLGLRPIRHQIESRTVAHIFITILAYHLLTWIERHMQSATDPHEWKTLRRILQTHCYTTIVIPTVNDGLKRIRKPGRPDPIQCAIYHKLDINWRTLPATRTR